MPIRTGWWPCMAPQNLYQIEASHLAYMIPFKGFPCSDGAVNRQGVGGDHLETLPSNSSGQERTASFIYQALQEAKGLCFLFPALLGFYNESLDTITKEQKCLWFDWQLTWQLFIHLNLKCILTKKSVFFSQENQIHVHSGIWLFLYCI